MNLQQYWKRFLVAYSCILSVSLLFALVSQQHPWPSLFAPIIGVILLSFILSLPAYFNFKVWTFCMSFFVIVAAFSVLRFLLYNDALGHAIGIVFFTWSLFLGFFVGAFLEALVHIGRYVQKKQPRFHYHHRRKKRSK